MKERRRSTRSFFGYWIPNHKDYSFIATNTETPETRELFFILIFYCIRKGYSDKIQRTEGDQTAYYDNANNESLKEGGKKIKDLKFKHSWLPKTQNIMVVKCFLVPASKMQLSVNYLMH